MDNNNRDRKNESTEKWIRVVMRERKQERNREHVGEKEVFIRYKQSRLVKNNNRAKKVRRGLIKVAARKA